MLLQVTLCLIKKVILLKTLWKVEQVLSRLQQVNWSRKTGLAFPFANFLFIQNFFVIENLVTPDYVFKVVVSLECQNWRFSKISFNFDSIGKIWQFLSIILLKSDIVLLQVTVSGKRSVLDTLFLYSNSFLGIAMARLIFVVVFVLL